MRSVPEAYTIEKNKPYNEPIFLYIIQLDSTITKYYCSYKSDTPIVFDGQEYEWFPISHDPVSENTTGEIDKINVTLSNVSRLVRLYLEQYNGLRRCKVIIRQVFLNLLDDPTAKIDDTYTVSQVSCDTQNGSLILSSKLDILSVNLPGRIYTRNDFPGIPYQRTVVS